MLKTLKSRGFTLLELSLVLLIISIMVGGVMTILTQKVRAEKQAQMQEKFDTIKDAMMNFARTYERLPCPSDLTLAVTAANFGIEGLNPGACTAGSPAATFASAGNAVYGGSVPTEALGLPYQYAFDPWGNRLLYAVDKNMTINTSLTAFRTYPPTSTSIGAITILDKEGDTLTSTAIYVILSFGPNGHGAYGLGGTRKNADSSNAYELENCDCTSAAVAGTFNSTFYKMDPTETTTALSRYDDYTMYVTRYQMLLAREKLTE